ncbi:MAG: hypothetical protein AB1652_07780 [Bacillota bacterium]
MNITPSGSRCPLGIWLEKALTEQVARIENEYCIAPSIAVCDYICPIVIGRREQLPDGRCAVHARLIMLMR